MGDRYDRKARGGWRHPGLKSLRPPSEIITWGLSMPAPAGIGHNQGPPLEEPAADAFVRYRWRKAHQEVWKNPSLSILRMRVARAEAAGLTYREYMLELLDSGRHLTAEDVAARRAGTAAPAKPAASRTPPKPQPLGGDAARPPSQPSSDKSQARRKAPKPKPL